MALKVAFGSVPKDSGTFTFYRNQQPELEKLGVDMYCVSVGKEEAELWEDEYADENCVQLAAKTYDLKKQAQAFVQWVEKEDIDIVIAINSKAILSSIPHLPKRVRLISRCANAFDYGYRITMSGENRLMAIIALTPRLKDDLIKHYGADPELIHLIPNGINAENYITASKKPRGEEKNIRLVFVGRLEHNQKGVLFLPDILKQLKSLDVPYKLKIAGKGKHEVLLKNKLSEEVSDGNVVFTGALAPQEIIELLGDSDIFIFTSQFEGCPNAVLEAMMAACVPVCYSIEGITDYLISEDRTGYILDKEDAVGMADQIKELHFNRDLIKTISKNTHKEAEERFTNEVCAAAYAKVFHHVMEKPLVNISPREWKFFKADPNIEKGKFPWIPIVIKKGLKKIIGVK